MNKRLRQISGWEHIFPSWRLLHPKFSLGNSEDNLIKEYLGLGAQIIFFRLSPNLSNSEEKKFGNNLGDINQQ